MAKHGVQLFRPVMYYSSSKIHRMYYSCYAKTTAGHEENLQLHHPLRNLYRRRVHYRQQKLRYESSFPSVTHLSGCQAQNTQKEKGNTVDLM